MVAERGPEDRNAAREEGGEDLPLDRDRAVGRNAPEELRLEHVDPGVDEVGRDLLGPRLLEEASDGPGAGRLYEPVRGRAVVGDEADVVARPACHWDARVA